MSHLGFLNCRNELFTYACFICDGIILFNAQVSIQEEEECILAVLVPAEVICQCTAVQCCVDSLTLLISHAFYWHL